MNREIEAFINDFLKEIREENAAIFAGAGLSCAAGYVNWRDLLRPVAQELGLNIEQEHDLIAIAQYHCNENGGNRFRLNQLILEKLCVSKEPTESHRTLARLPINTYWTTNYDKLIEDSLSENNRIPDVKHCQEQLAHTKPRRDALVYKMHGDVDHPGEAVITKDDYEKYILSRDHFITALAGDLVSKTFLFIGFSFEDPNLEHVLSRIKLRFNNNQRRHYCLLKKITRTSGEAEETFQYKTLKQSLFVKDLLRFNIKAVLVDEYSDIPKILQAIEKLYRQNTIFVSGSAAEYGSWGKKNTEDFLIALSQALIDQDFKIATGVGLGVGHALITGAIDQIYRDKKGHIEDYLIMRPFPLAVSDAELRVRLWTDYRKDIISRAGIAIFLLGNKEVDGKIVSADGVKQEFDIAHEFGLKVIPIGASGYISEELWRAVTGDIDKYYPGTSQDLKNGIQALGEQSENPNELISKILTVLQLIRKENIHGPQGLLQLPL